MDFFNLYESAEIYYSELNVWPMIGLSLGALCATVGSLLCVVFIILTSVNIFCEKVFNPCNFRRLILAGSQSRMSERTQQMHLSFLRALIIQVSVLLLDKLAQIVLPISFMLIPVILSIVAAITEAPLQCEIHQTL